MNDTTRVAPMSRASIRKVTNDIRNWFEISSDKPFSIVKFVEHKLVEQAGFILDIVPDSEMGGIYAEVIPAKRLFRIGETAYDNACDDRPHDRFTVAHEVGHLLLHTPDRVRFARTQNEIKPYENPEWQANTFAGELLVHTDSIRGLSVEDIANKYKVSYTVANIQKEKS